MFSQRIPWELEPNEYSKILERKRKNGERIFDLTESNPTRAGLEYPQALVEALANPKALLYEPTPVGLAPARQAVAELHGVDVDRVMLTASTSESYGYLFKLLCNPGDRVLVPRPSYPLFEFLATLESVTIGQYSLRPNDGWSIDFDSVESLIDARTRAILLVNPNNPTGSFIRPDEVQRLAELCARKKLVLVSDEVFACYPFDGERVETDWRPVEERSLVFRLNGLSKMAGLPQMKAGWMIVGGPEEPRRQAMERLELIADTYLSVSTPVQHALPQLLALGDAVRGQIRVRTAANLAYLRERLTILPVEGGWYAIVPLPPETDEYSLVLTLLEEDNTLVQPGFFFDFEQEGYLVLSLLTEPTVLAAGLEKLLPRLPDRVAPATAPRP